jgi:hypothetical protein
MGLRTGHVGSLLLHISFMQISTWYLKGTGFVSGDSTRSIVGIGTSYAYGHEARLASRSQSMSYT